MEEAPTQKKLWCAIPQRDHIVRVWAQRGPILPRQSKIAYLELPLVAVQDVARLQVAVQHPVLVQVVHPTEQLLHQALHLPQQDTQFEMNSIRSQDVARDLV